MNPLSSNSSRGSVLITTLILASVMALAIGSFLRLASGESRMASVAFSSNNSLNLAEAGIELALYSLNYEDWSGWSRSGSVATMDPYESDLGGSQQGRIQVRIEDYDTHTPIVTSEGSTILPNRPDVVKQVQIHLRQRGLFENGVTARDGVRFVGGNPAVDSYRSSLGPWDPNNNRLDNGSVASPAVEADAVTVDHADIWGRVATGGSPPQVGKNGTIRGLDTPPGVDVDPDRIALDYDSDFPEIEPPSNYDGYIWQIDSSFSLGTPGAVEPTYYWVNSVKLSGHSMFTIEGPVVLYVDGNIEVSGNAFIEIADAYDENGAPTNASLEMYLEGDMDIGGNGMANKTNVPANLEIYGTNSITQNFTLHGNAAMHAAVYAPTGNVSLSGGGSSGSMSGAVVGKDVVINGNYRFHYDEDLGNLIPEDADYRMDRWREIHEVSERYVFNP